MIKFRLYLFSDALQATFATRILYEVTFIKYRQLNLILQTADRLAARRIYREAAKRFRSARIVKRRPRVSKAVEAIADNNPLVEMLKKRGMIKEIHGGLTINEEIGLKK